MRVIVIRREGKRIRFHFQQRNREEVLAFLNEPDSHVGEIEKNLENMIDHNMSMSYEKKWKNLKEQYDTIQIFFLTVEAIGELIPRYLVIKNESGIKEKVLSVFIPHLGSSKRSCNDYLMEYISRDILLIRNDELQFWQYIIHNHMSDIKSSKLLKYDKRRKCPVYLKKAYSAATFFTEEEEKRGKEQMQLLHVTGDFVCYGARTALYNQATLGTDFDYDYRNMKFEDYGLSIGYLQECAIQAVRMGRMEQPIQPMDNCIDYAGSGADDFMDLFLVAHCKFLVVNATGIFAFASMFTRPVLMVNLVPISFGMGGIQYTQYDLFIPKKYYSKKEKRYLSLREITLLEVECSIWGSRYAKKGIQFVDNTPEEIREAVEEMQQRLDGTWIETEEDKANYKKYLKIYKETREIARKNKKNWTGEPLPYRLAASYLRNNKYLLD